MKSAATPSSLIALDSTLSDLSAAKRSLVCPSNGWLRSIREAQGLTQAGVAKKLGVQRQAIANFEAGELKATISLATLQRAARAMDCELVYGLVPRAERSRTFTELAARKGSAINPSIAAPTFTFPADDDRPEAGW